MHKSWPPRQCKFLTKHSIKGFVLTVFLHSNIVLDIVVVAIPMPYLWRLQMSTRKKVMIMLMFSGGLFVVVVSILRLQFLITFAHSVNLTCMAPNAISIHRSQTLTSRRGLSRNRQLVDCRNGRQRSLRLPTRHQTAAEMPVAETDRYDDQSIKHPFNQIRTL
jgi:hypothetical protein